MYCYEELMYVFNKSIQTRLFVVSALLFMLGFRVKFLYEFIVPSKFAIGQSCQISRRAVMPHSTFTVK
jgi:hypothetical protein